MAFVTPLLVWGVVNADLWGEIYGISEAAKVSTFLIAIAPVVAVSSAVNAWRLTPFLAASRARSAWATLLPGTGLSALVGVVVIILGAWLRAGSPTVWWYVLAPTLIATVAWSAIGALLGVSLRPLIGWPIALLGPFLLLTQTLSVADPRWRHLTGAWFGCCQANRTLAPGMAAATALLWASILATALAAVWAWDRVAPRRLAVISVGLAACLVVLTAGRALDAAAP
ncbi:hypothetical protein C1706_09230 [Propioniciclava flava]|uniref:Uncharacterized protein n=1 Tax=Propioniciclava flava TaxID=2072026 RepID=A0A4Q2EIK4_9ACTN|nr:hypothetical protein C1706_09230 [Propioniciclava flava]